VVVYALAAYSLWNIVDGFIENLKPRAIYRRSFPIYAMHLNIGIIILKVLSFALPQSEWVLIPRFIIMFILTLIIINLVCAFLEKFAPKIYGVLMGNRIKK
jgi:peptidoglycan/LPS O-acetylase OafA/YrhL